MTTASGPSLGGTERSAGLTPGSPTEGGTAADGVARRGRPTRHHWIVRVTHWVNFLALGLMVTTGLRIFNAYPKFARRGEIILLLSVPGEADSGRAHVRRVAGRGAQLALRGDVAAVR